MKLKHKGEFGYIAFQKKWTLIRTILYFVLCMLLLWIGIATTGSKRNYLTIVAVLGCLPACKSAVNTIMFLRAKGCSDSLHEKIIASKTQLANLYDCYMTSYKKSYALGNLLIAEKTIIGFCMDAAANINEIEEHISSHLLQDGYKDMTIKVYTDEDKYIERIDQLSHLDIKPLKVQNQILDLLLAISL